LLLTTIWCKASYFITNYDDGYSQIQLKKANIQGSPKDYAIQASIDGHTLTVVFTENLGQVTVEVSRTSGGETQVESTPTPNGVLFYIYDTGSYIVTFTLPNGDEYYGEFEVMD
jgi:hypothetical protein